MTFPQNLFNKKRYWVIHLSALKSGRLSKIFQHNIIEGIPVVSKGELDKVKISSANKIVEREIENLKKFGLIISNYDFILSLSKYKANAIIDNDRIKKRLKIRNIKYIDISQILRVLKKEYSPGERIKVKIVYKNVGYTDDCTKVIVQDRTFEEDDIIECWITQVVDGPSIKTVFCKTDKRNG